MIFKDLLGVFFIENHLEKTHLDMTGQFFYQCDVLNIYLPLDLITKPFVQFLNDVVLPLLRLDTGGDHALCRQWDNFLEIENDKIGDIFKL